MRRKASAMGMPWGRWLRWLLLAGTAVLSAAGWARIVQYRTWKTDARSVVWAAADGAPLESTGARAFDCDHRERHYVIDGARAWSVCKNRSSGRDHGGSCLVRIDIERLQGRRWPLVGGGEFSATRGMLPGPDDVLALVFYADAPAPAHLGLYGAVAGPKGWVHAPIPLGTAVGVARLLGMAWTDDGAEWAVTAPLDPADENGERASPAVIRLAHDGTVTRRLVSAETLLGRIEGGAGIELAYRIDDGWHFLVRAGSASDRRATWDAREDGVIRELPLESEAHLKMSVDAAAFGMVETPRNVGWQLRPDGTLVRHEERIPNREEGWRFGRGGEVLERQGDSLVRRPRFLVREDSQCGECPDPGRLDVVGGAELTGYCNDWALHAWIGSPTTTDGHRVALTARCGALTEPVWLPRPSGGYWLIGNEGRYVRLDAKGRRDDPLGPIEHLLREAARDNISPRRPPGVLVIGMLAFLLAGLPLFAGLVVVAIRRRLARTVETTAQAPRRLWSAVLTGVVALVTMANIVSLSLLWKLMW